MSLRVVSRHRTSGVAARPASLIAAAFIALATLWPTPASPASGLGLSTVDPLDEMNVLAVRTGDPTHVLFAAPARLMTETLTNDDVNVTVDGAQQSVRLQRLSAADLELAVVVDTTVGDDDLRTMQGAVVELALDLPPGATMRVIDAAGTAGEPTPVPGPAIAQIRQLRAGTDDNLQRAVTDAQELLGRSTQDRTALLVVGRDLDRRLEPIDDLPLQTTVAYVVGIGAGGDALLGPTASGTVIAAADMDAVLPAVDEMSVALRNLYRAEVAIPAAGARTLTLEIRTTGEDPVSTTVSLDPDSVRPVEVEPARAPQADGPAGPPAEPTVPQATDERADVSLQRVLAPLALAGLALVVLALLWLVARRSVRWRRDREAPAQVPVDDEPMVVSGAPRADRPRRSTRPIAKLAPETREALARAHLGLRRLALASRAATGHVPDQLFRLAEARASVALAGRDVSFDAALVAYLSDDAQAQEVELVRRAASALATGWQHTARRKTNPPPIVEISAVLTGHTTDGASMQRPVAPVRALNPLIEIGLDHVVLAGRPDQHSDLVARAITAVDVGRAARLSRPFLTLSPRLLQEAATYRAAIDADLNDALQRDRWLQLLCGCVALASADCTDQVTRLAKLRVGYREQAADPRSLPLVDLLIAQPIVDRNLVRRRLSVSDDVSTLLLSQATDAGWLQPHPRLPDVLVAEQVLSLFRDSNKNREHDSQPA